MAQIASLTEAAIIALVNNGTWPTNFPLIVGNASTAGDLVVADVSLASSVVLQVKNTGSAAMAAGIFQFEGSVNSTNGTDGDWVSLQAARTDSNTVENARGTSSLAAGTAQTYGWEISVAGYKWFRVRCSTTTTASSVGTWSIARGAYAVDPAPAIQPHGVTSSPASGTLYSVVGAATNNAAVVKSSSCSLMELTIFNPTAAVVYAKFYNKTGTPAPNTDTPIFVIPVPINGAVNLEFGANGKRFGTGLGVAIVALPANNDNTVVAAGVVLSLTHMA